jgi:exoribonuclease-2
MASPNDYVVYLGADTIKTGQVVRDQRTRLQVRDANGRIERVKADSVAAALPSSQAADAKQLHQQITEMADTIDTDLLWATLPEVANSVTPKQAATEYFGSATALEIAAAAHALYNDNLHFKRHGLEFDSRSHREVSDIAEHEKKLAERERLQSLAIDFFNRLLSGRSGSTDTPEEILPVVDAVEAYIIRGDNTGAEDILHALESGSSVRETGLRILDRLGRLGDNVDPQLLLHGISPHFSDRIREEAEKLEAYHPGEDNKREGINEQVFSIDDASTREIDDAFSVHPHDDGATVTVGIHIADPGWFIAPGSAIDTEAAERTLSLYLPTCTVTMLPPRIGTDLASLQPNRIRPAISLFATLDSQANVLKYRLALTEIRDSRRLDYKEADAILADPEKSDPLHKPLETLYRLAGKLEQRRIANGAVKIIRPDLNITVSENGDTIKVEKVDNESPAHALVGEFMVLLNHLLARFTLENDVPLIYRCQPPPANSVNPMAEYSPVLFDRAVKSMRPTFFSTHPQPHSGLGLDVYTQFSSPLRRYHDLVIQRQTVAFMHGTPLPYTQEQLVEVLGNAEQVEKRNRKVERELRRFWTLEYIRRNRLKQTVRATVVDRIGNTQLAEIEDYVVRGILRTSGAPPKAGTQLDVRITDVNPRNGTMVLQSIG